MIYFEIKGSKYQNALFFYLSAPFVYKLTVTKISVMRKPAYYI